jgi:hypothetical protein
MLVDAHAIRFERPWRFCDRDFERTPAINTHLKLLRLLK